MPVRRLPHRRVALALAFGGLAACEVIACTSFGGSDTSPGQQAGSTDSGLDGSSVGDELAAINPPGSQTDEAGSMEAAADGAADSAPTSSLGCVVGKTSTSACDDFESATLRSFWSSVGSPAPDTDSPFAGSYSLGALGLAQQSGGAMISASLSAANSCSLSLMFRTTADSSPGYAYDLLRLSNSTGLVGAVGVDATHVTASLANAAPVNATVTVTDGQWHHLEGNLSLSGTGVFAVIVDGTTIGKLLPSAAVQSAGLSFAFGTVITMGSSPYEVHIDNLDVHCQ
jgi:hypothetical protein